jgi:Peptidase inhibitor I78 family
MTTRLATYLLPALVGLSATGSAQSVPAPCREAAASFALGETYTDRLARQARRAAEARVVRKVEPGRSQTMEFRADRLNLDVDGRGTVLAVRCG